VTGSVGADPRIGSELLGYRVEELVGRGGMGVVYRAHDPRLKRSVAIKLLAPELSHDEWFRVRFLAETELAASLEHPNVVPIHDAGESDGQLYLVMRYVEGGTLRDLLDTEAPLEPTRAIDICDQIAAALDAAHARGLVHRDVKPSNVLRDAAGHVYLADFGLTRPLDHTADVGPGLSLGTPTYVAPEAIRGEAVDGRADQYALACVLHEALIGRPPFAADTDIALLFAHLEEPPPASDSPFAPPLARGLRKAPDERFASCEELVGAVRRAGSPPAPRRRRRPLVMGITLLAALILATVVALPGILPDRGGAEAVAVAGDGFVARIDPERPQEATRVTVGTDPSAIATSTGDVWVASMGSGTLQRIDPDDGQVTDSVVVADERLGPTGLAVTPRGVLDDARGNALGELIWVSDSVNGTFKAFDPAVDELLPNAVGYPKISYSCEHSPAPEDLALEGDAIWMAISNGVQRVSLQGGGVETVDLRAAATRLAYGEGSLWVVVFSATSYLVQIDPATREEVRRRAIPIQGTAIAVAEGALWVAAGDVDEVWRFDPRTLEVEERVPVGLFPADLATGGGAVWVANELGGTVSRIDTGTSRVTQTIEIGDAPRFVAFGHGSLWVTGTVTDAIESEC
jgi:YVTN family beta-propeller protein